MAEVQFSPEDEALIDQMIAEGKFSPEQLKAISTWKLQKANREQPIEPPAAAPPVAPLAPTPAPAPTPTPTPQRSLWERVKEAWDYDVRRIPGDVKDLAVAAWEAIPESKGSADPRDTTPWYQRLKQQFLAGQYAVDPSFGTVSPLPSAGATPEQHQTQMQAQQDVYGKVNREMLEWMPTIVAAIYGVGPLQAGAYKGLAALYREVGYPLIRAAYVYLGQAAAEEVANIVDPTRYTDPGKAASSEALGEFVGSLGGRQVGRVTGKVAGAIPRAFQETPMGTVRREVIESVGEQPTPGMVSEKFWPRSVDTILAHHPMTGRVRDRYASVQGKLDAELRRHSALHPGTRVTAAGDVLKGEIAGRSTPPILHSGPRVLRQTRDAVIEQANTRMDQVYDQLDTNYLLRPLDWGSAKPNLPAMYGMQDLLLDPKLLPQVGADSLFEDVLRINHALYAQPDTISLAGAFDLLKLVRSKTSEVYEHLHRMDDLVKMDPSKASPLTDSLQRKVLPVLGEMENQLNQLVRPYLVDISEARRQAARLVGAQEMPTPGHFRTSQATLQGGQASRFALMEDPHIQVARDLLLQPDFVPFTAAHQVRSNLLKVARQEGPLIDNVIAENGQKMADLVDSAMTKTAQGLSPDLHAPWRQANDMYRETKEMFDSKLMHEFKDMNLDDILTRLVKEERPNDMLLLREVLGKNPAGQDVFDTAAQMWLTRQIETARRKGGTRGLDMEGLRATLDRIGEDSEHVLFPRGQLAYVKERLERYRVMEDAVSEATKAGKVDALKLYQYKRALSDPSEWEAVQSDVLAHIFQSETEPHLGKRLLTGLHKLDHAKGVLFDPAHLEALTRLGHTASYVENAALSGTLHWNPLIRFGEHALGPTGGGLVGIGTHLLLHNPYATAGAIGGWLVSGPALAYLMTNPTAVRWLTQGMSSPLSAEKGGELIGLILAQLNNGGYEKEVTPLTGPPPGAGQARTPTPAPAGR